MQILGAIVLAGAIMATSVTADIALGHNGVDHLMWVEGKGSCTGKVISPLKTSRCGISVVLDDGNTCEYKPGPPETQPCNADRRGFFFRPGCWMC